MLFVGPLKVRAQVLCGAETAMGPGKADVLEAIDRLGSISAAGREIGMSYRRTWMLVDTMNRCWANPLVETSPGGGHEKGARLTAFGRQVLDSYRGLETRLAEAAAGPAEALAGLLLPSPRAEQPSAEALKRLPRSGASAAKNVDRSGR